MLDRNDWTNEQVARACGFDERHLRNILGGHTTRARTKTRKNIMVGMLSLGANEADLVDLFE